MSRTRKAASAGVGVLLASGLIGLLVGAAVQVNHPHHQRGWDAQYWLSGSLVGLASGVLFGALAAFAAWDLSR